MKSIRLSLSLRLAVFLGGAVFASFVHAGSPGFYFYLQGKKESLTVDAKHVAFQSATESTSRNSLSAANLTALSNRLAPHGLASAKLEPLVSHGWAKASTDTLPAAYASANFSSEHDRIHRILDDALNDNSLAFASPLFLDAAGHPMFITGKILIAFNDDATAAQQARALALIRGRSAPAKLHIGKRDHYQCDTTIRNGVDVLDLANQLAELPGVRYAEPDIIQSAHCDGIGSVSHSWPIKNTGNNPDLPPGLAGFDLNVLPAWNTAGFTGDGVTVIVFDDGVQLTGNDFLPNVIGRDFTPDNGNGGPVTDNDVHGTMVASIIGGYFTYDGVQYYSIGSAPKARIASARIMYSKTSLDSGTISSSGWSSALSWAQTIGARVTNASVHYNQPTNALISSYSDSTGPVVSQTGNLFNTTEATNNLIHFAAASYTDGTSNLAAPANIAGVNAIGGVDSSGNAAGGVTGSKILMVGPASNVFVGIRDDDPNVYGTYYQWQGRWGQGNSYASGLVAGVAALLVQQHPDWPAAAVVAAMTNTARRLGSGVPNSTFGYGMPDGNAAVSNSLWTMYSVAAANTVGTSNNVMIVGFNVLGSNPKPVLLRTLGPALTSYGYPGYLADPQMSLYNSQGTFLDSNSGWSSSPDAASISTNSTALGLLPMAAGSHDCAMQKTLSPGGYSFIVSSSSGATGKAYSEVYDLNPTQSETSINNLSSRSYANPGDTPGAVILIQGNSSKNVLIRAVGPTLSQFGISNYMPHPQLDLYLIHPGNTATTVATNTQWGTAGNVSDIVAFAQRVGAFPLSSGSADSVILTSLPPGLYKAQVSDTTSSAGVILIEYYKDTN